ncbi:MAG TPA: hypothetical protein VFJ21_12625 [Mycobacteriales bacterium]|nr:hypothetical protein [Mycobacteriales bacterium]
MTDLRHDGNYLVTWVPGGGAGGGIADLSAPTTTELAAGIQLECRLTPTGLTREPSTEMIDNSKLCSTFGSQIAGRTSYNLQIVAVREEGDTSGVEAALTQYAEGYFVVRDDKPATQAYAAADNVEVYPAQVANVAKSTPAANELQTITYTFANTDAPVLDAAVAAGA